MILCLVSRQKSDGFIIFPKRHVALTYKELCFAFVCDFHEFFFSAKTYLFFIYKVTLVQLKIMSSSTSHTTMLGALLLQPHIFDLVPQKSGKF